MHTTPNALVFYVDGHHIKRPKAINLHCKFKEIGNFKLEIVHALLYCSFQGHNGTLIDSCQKSKN